MAMLPIKVSWERDDLAEMNKPRKGPLILTSSIISVKNMEMFWSRYIIYDIKQPFLFVV